MRPDFDTLDEITRKLAENLPPQLSAAREELRTRFREVLETTLARKGVAVLGLLLEIRK